MINYWYIINYNTSLHLFKNTFKIKKINYTKERSDFFSKSDGTFVQREKKKLETNISTDLVKKKVKTEEKHEAKKINNTNGNEENSLINNPPNNVLFVEHVPTFATQEMMIELFKQYPGFK